MQVPLELLSGIDMKQLITDNDIAIKIPSPDEECNTIVLTGQLANVSKAKEALLDYVMNQQNKEKELDQEHLRQELSSLERQCTILMEKVNILTQ